MQKMHRKKKAVRRQSRIRRPGQTLPLRPWQEPTLRHLDFGVPPPELRKINVSSSLSPVLCYGGPGGLQGCKAGNPSGLAGVALLTWPGWRGLAVHGAAGVLFREEPSTDSGSRGLAGTGPALPRASPFATQGKRLRRAARPAFGDAPRPPLSPGPSRLSDHLWVHSLFLRAPSMIPDLCP